MESTKIKSVDTLGAEMIAALEEVSRAVAEIHENGSGIIRDGESVSNLQVLSNRYKAFGAAFRQYFIFVAAKGYDPLFSIDGKSNGGSEHGEHSETA